MLKLTSLMARMTGARAAHADETLDGQGRNDRTEILDNLARSVASHVSRRKALKLTAAGVFGVVLAELGVRPTWAFVTCNCNGVQYDPAVACCTPSGVQQKYPIVNLDACPGRVSHSGPAPTPNGCGPANSKLTPYIPNNYGAANFLPCCNTHDTCYGTCNNAKSGCDNSFQSCLVGACDTAYSSLFYIVLGIYQDCVSVANVYYAAVSLGGGGPYTNAQKHACDCCAGQTCNSCSPGTCPFAPVSCGSNCYCFPTAEGGGTCSSDFPCSSSNHCTSSSQCGPGSVCVVNTCCGPQGYCTPVCNSNSSTGLGSPNKSLRGVGPTASGGNH